MFENPRKNIYDEKVFINSYEPIDIRNKEKIALRKQNLNKKILNKRSQGLAQMELDIKININPELKFKMHNLEGSYAQVLSYLKSNNKDLIYYALNELRIYLTYNNINIEEEKIVIKNKLLQLLLNLGNLFLKEKNYNNIYQILWILINIQACDIQSKDCLIDLYSNEYFNFYNNCLIIWNNDAQIFNAIRWILDSMIHNNEYINLQLLRSDVFASILDYYENQNIKENEDIKLTLKLICYCVDLSNYESLFNDKDITIINKCLNIFLNDINGTLTEELLMVVYKGIYFISNLDTEYNFNKRIIDNGVTLKILKSKYYLLKLNKYNLKMIDYGLRIIANNLSISDNDCQIIFDQNIIDYYNNILENFDDYNIIRNIFSGIANITVGSKRKIVFHSIIWKENNIQKFCNLSDELKVLYIKIVKYIIYNADYDMLKFIFNTKILHYFLFLITTNYKSQIVCGKILRVINMYLKKFNKEMKETEEYLLIFHKLKDLIELSDVINKIDNIDIIPIIEENIKNNYK